MEILETIIQLFPNDNIQSIREKAYSKLLQHNQDDIKIEINKYIDSHNEMSLSRETKLKLYNRKDKYYFKYSNLTLYDFCKLLLEGQTGLDGLEKDPSKQGLDEILQLEYIKLHTSYDIKKLPCTGKSSLTIFRDLKGEYQLGNGSNFKVKTKTLDAYLKHNEKDIYFTFKYTRHSGGSQDNQCDDVRKTIEFFIHYHINHQKSNTILFVIIDGQYGEKKSDDIRLTIPEEYKNIIYVGNCQYFITFNTDLI